jgi:hypothetical protein
MTMNATNSIRPGQWYSMRTGPCDHVKITVTGSSGSALHLLTPSGLSSPAGGFFAVTENGRRLEITAHDLHRVGIGMIELCPDMPDSTPEDWQALIAKGEQERRKEQADATLAAEKSAANRAALPGMFPHLETRANSKKSSWALAAANIRRELAKAYPQTVFKITSKSYSMGCSVSVSWADGPTTKQVEAISDKYAQGDFNGMEDLYEYRRNDFGDVFGDAKYVQAQRDLTPAGIVAAWEASGGSPSDIPQDPDWTFWRTATGEMIRRKAWETDLSPAIEQNPATVNPASISVDSQIVEIFHTYRNCPVWIVTLSERIDRDAYNAALVSAKSRGGWYSKKWNDSPAGFAFTTIDAARAFSEEINGQKGVA